MISRSTRWRRAVAYLTRSRLDDELRAEIDDHLEHRRQQLMAEGLSPAEADAEARRAFGNVASVRDRMHDGWGFPSLDSLLQDARYGARILRKAPGFTAVAVLSLALGIGAAAAVFNVADAVLFRPLSVRDPGSLRDFRASIGAGGSLKKEVFGADPAETEALRKAADFADLIAFRTVDDIAWEIDTGEPRTVRAEFVSAEYFAVLGVPSRSGRLFETGDRGSSPVPVVVSDHLWRSAMTADPATVGRRATINGVPAVVVGIAQDFRGLTAERPADVFVPLESARAVDPSTAGILARVVMRLHDGTSTEVAEQKLTVLYRSLGPAMARAGELRLTLGDASRGVSDARSDLRWPIALGLVLVGVLMVVACANTGGLLVARFAARRTEFGVRMAIGAGRARLLRQLFVEALLLAVLAGAAALLIARVTAPMLSAAVPIDSTQAAFETRFDWRLMAFTLVASVAAAFGAAGVSLRQILRTDPSVALNDDSRSVVRGRRAAMDVLIASQIACSLLLLIVTVAMVRTLVNLRHVDPGFNPGGAVAFTVNASGLALASPALPAYFAGLHDRVAALPQVGQVSLVQMGLLTRGMTSGTVDVPGWSSATDEDRFVRFFFVGPKFFETAGMRIVAGQPLAAVDITDRRRVAVVTRQFAEFYFGGVDKAVGRFVNRDVNIVGVVADARYNSLRDAPVRAMFLPFTQAPPRSMMTFIVRPAGDQRQAIGAVTAAIRAHDSRLKVASRPMTDLAAATMGRERFAGSVAAGLALLALVLCSAGVYATVGFAVAERRREIALRFALGATGGDVARLVLRGPLLVALIGIAVAVPCSYALMRAMSALLFGVSPFDLPIVAGCGLGLMAIAVMAAALPAWRASTIEPHQCLKAQ
jgi:predicted permease